MCEPNHSITQWSDAKVVQDVVIEAVSVLPTASMFEFLKEELTGTVQLPSPDDRDAIADEVTQWFMNDLGTDLPRLQNFVGEDAKYLSAIDKFFHLSRFGDGHSESRVARLGRQAYVPPYSAYEVHWWTRELKFDFGSSTSSLLGRDAEIPRSYVFARPELLNVRRNHTRTIVYEKIKDQFRAQALKACEQYALRASIGTPQVLRRFLEETVQTTKRLNSEYRDAFGKLFSVKGVQEFETRLKLAGIPGDLFIVGQREEKELRTRLAKIVCGLTRTRKFLVPEWSDVERFWGKSVE